MTDALSSPARADRCPGQSYTDMLNGDTRPAPDYLLAESSIPLDDEPLDPSRYTSEAFAAAERAKLWPNIWHFAAREEDMPEPGDTVVYEIADRNYLLVRQEDGSIRAFHNVCLHRGRLLRDHGGRAVHLRCAFHGFTWHNDGSLKEVPCPWDFRHLEGRNLSLPQLRVERWQGFVMVTENAGLPPFRTWIGPGVEHYDNWRLDECHTMAWIGRVFPANWKATAEAFMEAFHAVVTHPQILGFTADANSRYDLYGDHMNRAITPNGALSPHVRGRSQRYVLDKITEFLQGDGGGRFAEDGGDDLRGFAPDDPLLARKVLAQANREIFAAMDGHDYSAVSDSEVLDNFTYNIFPNFAPWGGLVPNIVYRWRPWRDVDHCLMEVRILTRTPKGTRPPKAPPMHLIGEDETFMTVAHLIGPGLAGVFDQDLANLEAVQKGMKASANRRIELAHYQESRIRHFQRTLDKYLGGELP
ncbi:aromatic ring-hydroxylating dioxygenase subunit alpha [Sphingobium sp. Sx8-8]|uniref:aromatic ring-hydroxylating oxygenase subunit alpha n=1 Tax=Sphingobium sp. Sx8-8 TaxID=2933617 RepID=UPI001F59B844|nr:aromatic ring-hydroxylating dioxygenase subunit alpha [Sphingobium sp. Sx8-8]